MDLKSKFNNEKFVKIYLIITICISGLSMLFDLLGFLYIASIQVVADVFIITCSIILFGLVLLLYENVNREDPLGRKIRILSHGLLIYLGVIPLLLILGTASGSFLIDPSTIGIGLIVVSLITMMILFGYGIALSLLCLLKFKESKIWNF